MAETTTKRGVLVTGSSSEIKAEAELLTAFRQCPRRLTERRRLQRTLERLEVVGVEHVEHLPEERRRSAAWQLEQFADPQVEVLLVVAAPRVARLRARVDHEPAAHAVRQGAAVAINTR